MTLRELIPFLDTQRTVWIENEEGIWLEDNETAYLTQDHFDKEVLRIYPARILSLGGVCAVVIQVKTRTEERK